MKMKMKRAVRAAALAALVCASAASGMTMYPYGGTIRITGLLARDAAVDGANNEGFYIQIDGLIPRTECGYGDSSAYLHVPKKPGAIDNLFYRDLYNTAALAVTLQKPVQVYVQGCSANYPRVWGINMLP